MKKGLVLGLFVILVGVSFVSAVPKNFEVSNVYWATEGTIDDKPFLLGLVELSWESEKGEISSLLTYLDYEGRQYYSSSLGLIKDLTQLEIGIVEAQFYPLGTYASARGIDKLPEYSLIIPISQAGEIDFEGIRLSKLNQDLTIPESFRNEQSDSDNLFPNVKNLVACSKTISFDSSSMDVCDDDRMSKGEFDKCMEENAKINAISFSCSLLCLKEFYEESLTEEGQVFGECSVYNNMNFIRSSSDSLDFNELIKLNSGLEQFNPWRAGP